MDLEVNKVEKKPMVFDVKGTFVEKEIEKNFSKQVVALNQNNAIEKTLSLFGSKHGIKRRQITVKEVKESEGK